jgi:hypothetical protein
MAPEEAVPFCNAITEAVEVPALTQARSYQFKRVKP